VNLKPKPQTINVVRRRLLNLLMRMPGTLLYSQHLYYTYDLSWYTDTFAKMAQAAYQTIGEPAYTLDNAWSTFGALSNVLETYF